MTAASLQGAARTSKGRPSACAVHQPKPSHPILSHPIATSGSSEWSATANVRLLRYSAPQQLAQAGEAIPTAENGQVLLRSSSSATLTVLLSAQPGTCPSRSRQTRLHATKEIGSNVTKGCASNPHARFLTSIYPSEPSLAALIPAPSPSPNLAQAEASDHGLLQLAPERMVRPLDLQVVTRRAKG